MVAQPWSHNTMISRAPDAFVLYQIGDADTDQSLWTPCYNSSDALASTPVVTVMPTPTPSRVQSRGDPNGVYLRSAPSLEGPWAPFLNNSPVEIDFAGSWATAVNGGNPAPFFFVNGTVLLYFSANPCPPNWGNKVPGNNCIGVAVADSWRGPYSVARANALPVTHPESEDAHLFRDPRGHFHLLTNVNNDHARCAQGVPCGGHAWSKDGLTFSNLTIGAFGPVTRFANGTYSYNAYVERPQVTQAGDGTPLAFFVGMGRSSYNNSISWAQLFCVQGAENCGPTLPPPPPPPTLVRYRHDSGLCLSTNASSVFPCAGGWGTTCPTFLASCALPQSTWQERADGPEQRCGWRNIPQH